MCIDIFRIPTYWTYSRKRLKEIRKYYGSTCWVWRNRVWFNLGNHLLDINYSFNVTKIFSSYFVYLIIRDKVYSLSLRIEKIPYISLILGHYLLRPYIQHWLTRKSILLWISMPCHWTKKHAAHAQNCNTNIMTQR